MNFRVFSVLCALVFGFSPEVFAQIDSDFSAGGGIRIGASTSTCDGTTVGALRYSSGNGCVELCHSSAWECINATASCDGAPAPLDFTDIVGASTSALLTSNVLLFAGTDSGCSSSIGISGGDSPEYRICSDATCSSEIQTWSSANSSHDVSSSTYVQVRDTSAATDNAVVTVTLSAGGVETDWSISTGASGSCGASPTVGDVCADGSVYAGISPDGNQHMYVARCDIGMSWDGSDCTGARSQLPFNNGNTSGLTLAGTITVSGSFNTSVLVAADSDSVTAGVQPHQAAQACEDLNVHGNTDWYLPATNELLLIYENLLDGVPNDNSPDPLISGFSASSYWTSEENNSTHSAFKFYGDYVGFSAGSESALGKNNEFAVRCARQD